MKSPKISLELNLLPTFKGFFPKGTIVVIDYDRPSKEYAYIVEAFSPYGLLALNYKSRVKHYISLFNTNFYEVIEKDLIDD